LDGEEGEHGKAGNLEAGRPSPGISVQKGAGTHGIDRDVQLLGGGVEKRKLDCRRGSEIERFVRGETSEDCKKATRETPGELCLSASDDC
jgi:hypothetical protein